VKREFTQKVRPDTARNDLIQEKAPHKEAERGEDSGRKEPLDKREFVKAPHPSYKKICGGKKNVSFLRVWRRKLHPGNPKGRPHQQ